MKNIYSTLIKSIFLVLLMSYGNYVSAQCVGGTIKVTTALCSANLATLHLNGHTKGPGIIYQWFSSNDNGLSWINLTGATADTLNVSASLVTRIYRCRIICPTGVAFSDIFSFTFLNRNLIVTGKICSPSGLNDSITISLTPLPAISSDSNSAKNILWQGTTTNGAIWDNVTTNKTSITVKYNPINPITYRAIISLCPLNLPLPSTPPLATVNTITAGAKSDFIGISSKNCLKDSARISMASIDSTLKNQLIFRWYESSSSTGPFVPIGTDSAVNIKVTNQNKYYKSVIKLCANSKDSSESVVFPLITKLGANTVNLSCDSNKVTIDYANRLAKANSTYTYWTVSLNDSLNPIGLPNPVDSFAYSFVLQNHTDNYYKIYSKFCSTSTTILDSTYNIRVMLNVDSGQILGTYQVCPKDSVLLSVKNFNAKSSFPIFNYWEYSKNGLVYSTINIPNSLDTAAIVKALPGYSYYRKSIKFCNDKFAKSLYSTVATIYQPNALVCNPYNCSGNNEFKVANNTASITDYTGVKLRPAPFSYRWLETTNNGATYTVVPGATADKLTIPATCGSTTKYIRESYACSSSIFPDRTDISYTSIPFSSSMTPNGRAVTTNQVCLNDSVNISVVDNATFPGATCEVYSWQYSKDNVNWVEMGMTNASISAIVTNSYQYFRRVTKFCPTGQTTYSAPLALYFNQSLPFCDGFDYQLLTGQNILNTCWRYFSPSCSGPTITAKGIWSFPSGGKTGSVYVNRNINENPPDSVKNDGKLVTPAFKLLKGHTYRLSFWHKESIDNLSWDTLFTNWGYSPNACDITNTMSPGIGRFSYEQWNRYWVDFSPEVDSVYYFGIVYRDTNRTIGNIFFDDICVSEVQPCNTESAITKGRVVAPQKDIDRNEFPGTINSNYNKDRVRHQYCIGDTLMLTYQDNNYVDKFDYWGMTYQFYKRINDGDWHVDDTFFKKIPDSPWWGSHMYQKSAYQTINIVATDTHTWYKIVATCTLNGKEFHSDSLLVNGTHSLPYCENWNGAGSPINNPNSPLQGKNSGNIEMIKAGPKFDRCPNCWKSYNVSNISANNFYSVTLPFRNPTPIPQLYPDGGYIENNVVINYDIGAPGPVLTRKILVFPAVRMYKNRAYRISFRWTDNRQNLQSPYGNVSQKSDSLFLIIRDSIHYNLTNYDTFNKPIHIKQVQKNVQSNYLESGTPDKYNTYWYDFSPSDTGTYYVSIAQVAGTGNGNPYRFYMDYFCIDTLSIETPIKCTKPEFIDPLRVQISPDGVFWSPGDVSLIKQGPNWCVGNQVCLEFNWGIGQVNNWKYGWKYLWQINTVNPLAGAENWVTVDSSNRICYTLSYKYRNYRILMKNVCGDTTIVGPFGVFAPGGNLPWREGFEANTDMPPCWDFFAPIKFTVEDKKNLFGKGAKCSNNFLSTDYYTNLPSNPRRNNNTVIPPGFGVVPGITYRFSFWYMDNGISQPYDSIKVGWSYIRATENYPPANTLPNKVNGTIVKNSKEGKWRYYTAEYTAALDTAVHFKVSSFSNPTFANYYLLFDDFCFKPKYNNDALVIAIDSPVKTCNLNANSTLKIKVMNIGNTTQPNIPIQYSINGSAPVSAVVPGPVPSNGVVTYNLTGVDMSPLGDVNVVVWTNLSNDQDRGDDTFCTTIVHDKLFAAPANTGDTVCKYDNLVYSANTPNKFARWYKNPTDTIPFLIGDTIRIDSFQKDTCFYVSASNSEVCYTTPNTYSQGVAAYSSATDGLKFNNTSKDTLILDSLTVYAANLGTGTISLSQYGVNNVNGNAPITISPPASGKYTKRIGWKIPPGTDYIISYTGTISLAYLKNFIYQAVGCPSFSFNITSGLNSPTQYNYFFNMKLLSPGCESPKTQVCFTKVDNPVFNIKDTNRVCQVPQYSVCAPTAPAGNNYTYQWNINNATTSCVPAVNSAIYHVTVTNQYGCKYHDSLDLIVDPSPIFDLGSNQTFCRFTPYVINTGLDSNSNTVVWNNGGAGVQLSVLNPGTYIATAFNTTNFCVAKDTITLTRLDLPVFSLGNDRVECSNSVNIGSALTNTSLNYTWDDGSTAINRVVSNSGTYWVKGTDPSTGCSSYDTVSIVLKNTPPANLGPDSIKVCGTTTKLSAPVGNYIYLWNTTATTSSIDVSNPGKYYVTVSDITNGCHSYDSVKVEFYTIPVFDLGSDVIKNCNSNSYALNAPIVNPSFNYTWKLPDGTTQTNSSVLATKSGIYFLTINNGCYSFRDSVKLVFNGNIVGQIDLLKDTVRACNATTLTATSSPTAGNINWGAPLNKTTNSVYITQSGSYPVSISNECGSSTKTSLVIIDKTPVANFKVDTPSTMSVGLTNLSTNAQNTFWTFGDDSSSTDNNPVHIYKYEGSYVITLQVTNTCGTKYKSINIPRRYKKSTSGTSSIANIDLKDAEIILYPNPTSNKTQLYGKGLPNGSYKISVVNTLGQTVLNNQVKIQNGTLDVTLDANNFANGEYLIKVESDNDTVVKKLIVTK